MGYLFSIWVYWAAGMREKSKNKVNSKYVLMFCDFLLNMAIEEISSCDIEITEWAAYSSPINAMSDPLQVCGTFVLDFYCLFVNCLLNDKCVFQPNSIFVSRKWS